MEHSIAAVSGNAAKSGAPSSAARGAGAGGGSAGAGAVVWVVKEWREVLAEVGDRQALVASLKQSPHFGLVQVCTAASASVPDKKRTGCCCICKVHAWGASVAVATRLLFVT